MLQLDCENVIFQNVQPAPWTTSAIKPNRHTNLGKLLKLLCYAQTLCRYVCRLPELDMSMGKQMSGTIYIDGHSSYPILFFKFSQIVWNSRTSLQLQNRFKKDIFNGKVISNKKRTNSIFKYVLKIECNKWRTFRLYLKTYWVITNFHSIYIQIHSKYEINVYKRWRSYFYSWTLSVIVKIFYKLYP